MTLLEHTKRTIDANLEAVEALADVALKALALAERVAQDGSALDRDAFAEQVHNARTRVLAAMDAARERSQAALANADHVSEVVREMEK